MRFIAEYNPPFFFDHIFKRVVLINHIDVALCTGLIQQLFLFVSTSISFFLYNECCKGLRFFFILLVVSCGSTCHFRDFKFYTANTLLNAKWILVCPIAVCTECILQPIILHNNVAVYLYQTSLLCLRVRILVLRSLKYLNTK